ncbi:transposable element tcb2 transposase [Plakobranchus ocellatus]|uniref:Transposable element tcb2 transposase n=1 Tax=Plakobranchus ocellatus TaxID=259542 RepID=A0AAV3Y034_9GAST|nr:transposable element tcb2 transposase [Plakobranchus ocellatus]
MEKGVSIYEEAGQFHVQRRIIRNLWQRFQQRGVTTDLPQSGRPRITTCLEEYTIAASAQSFPHSTINCRKLLRTKEYQS